MVSVTVCGATGVFGSLSLTTSVVVYVPGVIPVLFTCTLRRTLLPAATVPLVRSDVSHDAEDEIVQLSGCEPVLLIISNCIEEGTLLDWLNVKLG